MAEKSVGGGYPTEAHVLKNSVTVKPTPPPWAGYAEHGVSAEAHIILNGEKLGRRSERLEGVIAKKPREPRVIFRPGSFAF